jgi:hypothetical protein
MYEHARTMWATNFSAEGPRERSAPEGIVRPRFWPCYGPTAKPIYPMATVQVPRWVYNGVCHVTRVNA